MSNMTTQRRADLRAMADAEYASIKGGEVYHTVHHPDFMGLLDDADRCAELEAENEKYWEAMRAMYKVTEGADVDTLHEHMEPECYEHDYKYERG